MEGVGANGWAILLIKWMAQIAFFCFPRHSKMGQKMDGINAFLVDAPI